MKQELLLKRRDKLNSMMDNGSALILFAAKENGLSFVQNNSFLYLAGLEIPNAILVLSQIKGSFNVSLYIERTIPERIVWDGAKMDKEEASEISGIKQIHYLDEFNQAVSNYLANTDILYLETATVSLDKPLTTELCFAKNVKERFPQIRFDNAVKLMAPLRMKKDEWEVEQLKKAIDHTANGISKVYREAKVGMYEYQLEAMIYNEMLMQGVRNWGFKPIIACGKNAVTLHYCENREVLKNNKLVLLDVGALYNNYSADISRTFPIGKSFTKRQREIYEEVLQVQKIIINMVEPGISLKELNLKTVDLLTEAMFRLKLIKTKSESRKYYMHGVSHFLGMEAHDIFYGDTILEPGNVITVEPGLYIEEEEIGVRIEDDILVTDQGYEILSEGIPKEVTELEAIRKQALAKK